MKNLWILVLVVLVSGAMSIMTAVLITTGAAGTALTSLGLSRVYVKSETRVDIHGTHIRLVGDDGNFEFEHAAGTPLRINSYYLGTATRTPVGIGTNLDGQDVVELQVKGAAPRTKDLQEWIAGDKVLAAVDAQGGLRISGVTLSVRRAANAKLQLVATFPSGTSAVVASG